MHTLLTGPQKMPICFMVSETMCIEPDVELSEQRSFDTVVSYESYQSFLDVKCLLRRPHKTLLQAFYVVPSVHIFIPVACLRLSHYHYTHLCIHSHNCCMNMMASSIRINQHLKRKATHFSQRKSSYFKINHDEQSFIKT